MTKWEQIRKYFGFLSFGTSVSRQQMMFDLHAHGRNEEKVYDEYRSVLKAAGYLISIRKGLYKVAKPMPFNKTIRQVRMEAYGK